MIAPARVAAYDVLTALSRGHSDLPTLLGRVRTALPDERDRALATDIATGVQRWRATLDHIVAIFAKRRIERLDPEIVDILRLSAYQLLHLTRVPASAVVDDAVDLTRRAGKRSATGFVNAVLRTISRNRAKLPLPPRPGDPTDRDAALQYLSVTLSHPGWLASRWLDRYGFEATERWLLFNNERAPLTLRRNPLRCSREQLLDRVQAAGATLTPTTYAPDGFIAGDRHAVLSDVADEGWFFVQDEASQLVTLLAGLAPGPLILDTCASPGGKTTALAASAQPGSRVVACDVRERRMALLHHTVALSGARNVLLVEADLLQPLPFRRPFDVVFVDAPCSGLGTLRRDPDIKWRRRESDLASLAESQTTMIRNAAALVAPGGRLVYATCSSEPEEDDAVVERFAATPDFDLIDAKADGLVPADLVDESGFFRTLPHRHGLEAFFGAVLRRRRS